MAGRGKTKEPRQLIIELKSTSGDEVEPYDFIRAAKKIKPIVQSGALRGKFTLTVEYSATGSLETASYECSWRIE